MDLIDRWVDKAVETGKNAKAIVSKGVGLSRVGKKFIAVTGNCGEVVDAVI